MRYGCWKGKEGNEGRDTEMPVAAAQFPKGQADADGGRLRFWSATCYGQGKEGRAAGERAEGEKKRIGE